MDTSDLLCGIEHITEGILTNCKKSESLLKMITCLPIFVSSFVAIPMKSSVSIPYS